MAAGTFDAERWQAEHPHQPAVAELLRKALSAYDDGRRDVIDAIIEEFQDRAALGTFTAAQITAILREVRGKLDQAAPHHG